MTLRGAHTMKHEEEADLSARPMERLVGRSSLEDTMLQQKLVLWAKQALPEDADHLAKLREEWDELMAAPSDPMEMADVVLALMLHAADHGVDLLESANQKFAVVQGRQYGPADERGISRHTERLAKLPPGRHDEVYEEGVKWLNGL